MPKNGIPDRWEYYLPIGEVIGRTRFIAFKVPLKESLCSKLPELERFTPSILLNSISKLGMVIDLTNTNRYYNSTEITHCGIDYLKILCEGRVVPNKIVVKKFFDAVEYYLQNNNNGLIGVHCTHGVNRTGYLICRYMVEKLDYTVKDAINEFNKARGHDMERKEYIEHLYNLNSNICEKQYGQIINKADFKEYANEKLSSSTSSSSQDSQENVAWKSKYRNKNSNNYTKTDMNYRKHDERNKRDCYRRNFQSTRWQSTERNAYDNFHYKNKFRNNNFSNKLFSKNIQYNKGNFSKNSFQNSIHRSFNSENSFFDRYVYCERNQNNFQSMYKKGERYYTNKHTYFSD